MLFIEIAILIIILGAIVTVLIYLAEWKLKDKPFAPPNSLWVFYLLEKLFGENDSCSREVKENELP